MMVIRWYEVVDVRVNNNNYRSFRKKALYPYGTDQTFCLRHATTSGNHLSLDVVLYFCNILSCLLQFQFYPYTFMCVTGLLFCYGKLFDAH